MDISISYGLKEKQTWIEIQVPDGSTVEDVIKASGILDTYKDIDLSTQKVGIFGKLTKLKDAVNNGDRVEIYRAITADPKTVKRRDSEEEDD